LHWFHHAIETISIYKTINIKNINALKSADIPKPQRTDENAGELRKTVSAEEQVAILQKELRLEREKTEIHKNEQEVWKRLFEDKIEPMIEGLNKSIKMLQNDLHVKNQELSDVLQSLSGGLVVTDLKGQVKSFNRSAIAITGIEAVDAVGESINDLFKFNILPEPLDEKALERVNLGFNQQFIYRKTAEKEIVVESTTTLMESENKEWLGIIINLNDITVLKRLEEEAERKNRLTAAGQIAMQVAHEIRNPLGSIELFTSMMKKDLPDNSHEKELTDHITSAARSMNHIISNLLEYTKPRPVVLEKTDIHQLLEEFIEFCRFSAEQHQVEIDTDMMAETHWIKGNSELLKQVFHNLFVNACQAMPEGGRWIVRSENIVDIDPAALGQHDGNMDQSKTDKTFVKVEFEDDGKGMSDEVKKRIFDPFYTTREKGTGLGMSIVQSTLRSHGGSISVESELDAGSKISLFFPLYPEASDKQPDVSEIK